MDAKNKKKLQDNLKEHRKEKYQPELEEHSKNLQFIADVQYHLSILIKEESESKVKNFLREVNKLVEEAYQTENFSIERIESKIRAIPLGKDFQKNRGTLDHIPYGGYLKKEWEIKENWEQFFNGCKLLFHDDLKQKGMTEKDYENEKKAKIKRKNIRLKAELEKSRKKGTIIERQMTKKEIAEFNKRYNNKK